MIPDLGDRRHHLDYSVFSDLTLNITCMPVLFHTTLSIQVLESSRPRVLKMKLGFMGIFLLKMF